MLSARHRSSAWRAGALGLMVLASLALAACSSGPSTPASTSTPSTTTTTTAASTTSSPSTTAATTAGVATCQPSQLAIAIGQSNGAAGTIEIGITFTNSSSTTCALQGYPGMLLLDASANPLPTNVVRGGMNFEPAIANSAPTQVVIGAGQPAGYTLSYSDVPTGNETSCPSSTAARVTPPNDTAYATISLAIAPCSGGTIHVSPVYPGAAP